MTDSKIGGAEKVVFWLSKGLDKERFNVTVCSLAKKGPIFDEMERSGVKVCSLGIRSRCDFFKVLRLIKLLREENIQILHSHLFHANLLARIIGRFVGVTVVISTEHIMGLESKWRLFLNKLTSGLADKIIAVSFGVKDFLVKMVGIESVKIAVVQNGIECIELCFLDQIKEEKRKELGLSARDKVIGTVARIHKQKGHVYLLYAVKEVVKVFPEAKFLIVGDGPLENKMRRLAVDLKITQNVVFTGFHKDIPGIMSILDIFVLPSLWEGLPITILEAMAMKKPVIATRVGGDAEIVVDGLTGILVVPKDSQALASGLIMLLKNEILIKKMGEAGCKRVAEYFNAGRMIKETEEIYEKLIQSKIKC